MFRLKIALAFTLVITLLVGVVYVLLHSQVGPALEEDSEIALRRTALIAEKSHRLDEFALIEKAQFVAQRPDLHEAMLADYEGDAEYERHMAVHQKLDRDQIYFTQFLGKESKDVRNVELDLLRRRPYTHEIFMATDATGKGVATLGKDLLSWFGDNVAQKHPVILDVIEKNQSRTDTWLWSFSEAEEKQLYTVAIAPIRARAGEKPIGVIVMGSAINDGVARRSQSLLAGRLTDEGNALTRRDTRDRSLIPEIAYFQGGNIHGSTLTPTEQRLLKTEIFETHDITKEDLPEQLISVDIDSTSYSALVRFFPGQHTSENPSGFVVMTNAELARGPVAKAQSNILFVGAAFLVIGLMLLLALIYTFLKPFERIEQGIQEIIAGNKDYEFETDNLHENAASLGQMLNLMSASLQGKPMPDDDGAVEGWGELGPGGTSPPKTSSAAPKVQGVMMPGMGKKKDKDKEPAAEEDVT